MNNHRYKEGLIFVIKSLEGIDNRLYLGNECIELGKLYIGDKVKLIYSNNKNKKLEYEVIPLRDDNTEILYDGKELYSDFMTEDEIDMMINGNRRVN